MSKEELRLECERLVSCKKLSDTADILNIFSEFMFRAVKENHLESVDSQANAEAKIVLQMMFTKILHMKNGQQQIIKITSNIRNTFSVILFSIIFIVIINNNDYYYYHYYYYYY